MSKTDENIQIYKNETIRWDAHNLEFYVDGRNDESQLKGLKDESLKKLRAKIDQAIKKRFKPIRCIISSYGHTPYKTGTITAINLTSNGDFDRTARGITDDDEETNKRPSLIYDWKHYCFPLNDKNFETVEQIEILQIAIKDMQDEIAELAKKLKSFSDIEKLKARNGADLKL